MPGQTDFALQHTVLSSSYLSPSPLLGFQCGNLNSTNDALLRVLCTQEQSHAAGRKARIAEEGNEWIALRGFRRPKVSIVNINDVGNGVSGGVASSLEHPSLG